jgi:hypothetical protein
VGSELGLLHLHLDVVWRLFHTSHYSRRKLSRADFYLKIVDTKHILQAILLF